MNLKTLERKCMKGKDLLNKFFCNFEYRLVCVLSYS